MVMQEEFNMLGFTKKDQFLMRGTHAREVEELDYGIKTEEDRIAANALGPSIALCTAYKMAVERSRVALGNADLPLQKIGEWTRHLNQDEKSIKEMCAHIKEQFAQASIEVEDLPEAVKAELALELGIAESTEEAVGEEADITEQLLQEDTPEARAKKKRKALKQQKKEAGKEAKGFLQIQKTRAEKLSAHIHLKEVEKRVEVLEGSLAPMLEKQAKVVVERAPEKKVPEVEAQQHEFLLKQLEKQMQESSPSSSGSDASSIFNA
jgi:hypothetical protein